MCVKLVAALFDGKRAPHQIGGFVEAVEVFDRKREIVQRVRIVWIEFERFAVNRFRFLGPLQFA